MKIFDGISFNWALIILGTIALIFSIRAAIAWHSVRRDAQEDYSYKKANGMIPDSFDRESYERIYRRVYNPRSAIYIAGGMISILLATPVAMWIFAVGLNFIYNLSGQNRTIEPGFLVWQFFLFFGMIFVWVTIGYLIARRYHRTTPGSLQFEMDQHIYNKKNFGETF